jgi:hypothetical protein
VHEDHDAWPGARDVGRPRDPTVYADRHRLGQWVPLAVERVAAKPVQDAERGRPAWGGGQRRPVVAPGERAVGGERGEPGAAANARVDGARDAVVDGFRDARRRERPLGDRPVHILDAARRPAKLVEREPAQRAQIVGHALRYYPTDRRLRPLSRSPAV